MPADSDQALPELPHTWRPLGVRVTAVFVSVMLLVVCVFAWIGFSAEVRDQFTLWQRLTLVGFGVLIGGILYALFRSRVTATEDGLVVVNGYRTYRYEWAQIIAVRMPSGAPWATLDLGDGTTAQVLALQGSDGERARSGVRVIRALLDR